MNKKMNKIILFNKACIYNKEKNKTIIFGQYNTNFQNIILSQDINYNIIHCIRKGKHFRGKAYNNRKSNNRQDFDLATFFATSRATSVQTSISNSSTISLYLDIYL